MKNEDFFERIDTEEKAYILGFIATDGNVYHCKRKKQYFRLGITLSYQDIDILEKIRDLISPQTKITKTKRGYAALHIYSRKIFEDLQSQGIMPKKTFKVKPPRLDKNLMCHYWRGAFDGDGGFYITKNANKQNYEQWRAAFTGNKFMCKGFSDFIEINKSYDKMKRPKMREHCSVYQSQYTGLKPSKNVARALQYDDCKIYMNRKYELAMQIIEQEIHKNHPENFDKKKLLDLYSIYGNWSKVGKELDIPHNTMYNIAKELGLPRRKKSSNGKRRSKI